MINDTQKISIFSFFMGLILCAWVLPLSNVHSAETKRSDRQKVLAFDDPSLVEGVNKQPFDSLSQLGKNQKNKKTRLYRKRTHFPVENAELISELAVSP